MTANTCKNCGAPVREINYVLGPLLMHVAPEASFPTEHKGTAWRHCRQSVAELETCDHLYPPAEPGRPCPSCGRVREASHG